MSIEYQQSTTGNFSLSLRFTGLPQNLGFGTRMLTIRIICKEDIFNTWREFYFFLLRSSENIFKDLILVKQNCYIYPRKTVSPTNMLPL